MPINSIHSVTADPATYAIESGCKLTLKVDYSCEVTKAQLCVGSESDGFAEIGACKPAGVGTHLRLDFPVTITRTGGGTNIFVVQVKLLLDDYLLDSSLRTFTVE